MRDITDTQSSPGASSIDAQEVLQAQLFVLLERMRPLAGGARHSLSNVERVVFGRWCARASRRVVEDGRPTLYLSIPDGHMSATHAHLERDAGRWVVRDRLSRNGVRRNGLLVKEAALCDGDVVELGRTLFLFRGAMSTPANAPGDVESCDVVGLAGRLGVLDPLRVRDLETLARIARSDVSVLLEGETGTGKEVLARALHVESRRTGPFVAVNCGALPRNLVESLLFGHKKGAFSGATRDELGFVRAAHEGTLFLDEIGDLPGNVQVVLLRLLQEREVVPLGATRPVSVDTRVVAATHRSLAGLTRSGASRHDLFARLAHFTYRIPSLRERTEDLGALVAAILPKVAADRAASLSLSSSAVRHILEHRWPANVRELEQRLKVSVLLTTGDRVESAPAAPSEESVDSPVSASRTKRLSPEDEALFAALLAQMAEHRGNLTQIAKAMGKDRRQIQRSIVRFQLDVAPFRVSAS